MAPRLALCFLCFVLLLLMNGQGCSARDMKLLQEQAEEKAGYISSATHSSNQPYLDGWVKDTQVEGKSARNSNPPYLDGWVKDTQVEGQSAKNSNPPYLDGWVKNTQEEGKTAKNSNPPYLDGWVKNTQEEGKTARNSNPPYLDGWVKNTQEEGKSARNSNPPYLDGWVKNTQEQGKSARNSNPPYLDGWVKNTQEEGKSARNSNPPYLDGWVKNTQEEGKTARDSNPPYLDGWVKNTQEEGKSARDSNPAYLDGWLKNTKEEGRSASNSNPAFLDGWVKNTQEEGRSASNSNPPYLDGWVKNTQEEGKSARNSNPAYLDGWVKNTQEEEKSAHNPNPAYLDGWVKNSQDGKEKTTHNPNPAYLDGWYKNSQNKIANYKKIEQGMTESEREPSSKVDHTAAFKALFFTLEDLYVGNVMTLQFPVKEYAHFLPRKAADSIPFSTSQLPSLLQLFLTTEDSPQGQDMKDVLEQCEFGPRKGETKTCATSLESMVEFVHSILGTESNYNILTTSYPTASTAQLQNYTVLEVSKDIYAPKWVACHPRPYPHAVYYCHYLDIGSKVFKVLLGGHNGEKMDALGICHLDTSDMNPNHFLFKQLGIKPGEAPMCHFFPILHLLWVPLPQKATV